MTKLRNLFFILAMGYLLGIQNGWIALWKDGNPEPERVFPFSFSLPFLFFLNIPDPYEQNERRQ